MPASVLQLDTKLRLDHADVLLFDPILANRTTLRTSLEMIGFRHITVVADHHEIPELVHHHLFDLFVADVTQHTDKLCGAVRAMREGKLCLNPFVHVVLMAWKLDNEVVRRALNCGADEFVTRPFSVAFLGARIKAATETRADFVVTGDYVGPDRRRDQTRRGAPTFVAPNSMQAKCAPSYDATRAAALLREIKSANEKVGVDRIRRCSIQMPLVIRALKQSFTDMEPLEPGLNELAAIAKDTHDRADHAGMRAAVDLTTRLVKAVTGARSGVNVAGNIDDAERLALDVYLAVNPGCTIEQLNRELEQVRPPASGRR